MISTSFDFDISLMSASLAAVKSMYEGSFFLPIFGTGAKKGLSVSINIFSNGNDLNVFCTSKEFLNVIIPLAEKYEFNNKSFFENSLDPVKQCIKILGSSFLYEFSISYVSLSAFLFVPTRFHLRFKASNERTADCQVFKNESFMWQLIIFYHYIIPLVQGTDSFA